jgi:purine-binding chemotaxis protein CheW
MNRGQHFVVFVLDERRFALRLTAVERVVRLVEITALPDAPEMVLGVINVHGRIIPAVSLRQRLRLPEREPRLSDQLVVAHTARRTVALLADAVTGVIEAGDQEVASTPTMLPGLGHEGAVVNFPDGMVPILDLDTLFPLDDECCLSSAEHEAVERRA